MLTDDGNINITEVRVYDQFSNESNQFIICSPSPDDVNTIYELVIEAYRDDITQAEEYLRFSSPGKLQEEMVSAIAWFILKCNNKVIGTLHVIKDTDGKHHLRVFAINKKYRKLGLGKKMLQAAEQELVAQKVNEIFCQIMCRAVEPLGKPNLTDDWMTVKATMKRESHKLVDYYESQGYQETGYIQLPSLDWQKRTRKQKYYDKIFVLETKKQLLTDCPSQ